MPSMEKPRRASLTEMRNVSLMRNVAAFRTSIAAMGKEPDAPARLRAWMAEQDIAVKVLARELSCTPDCVSDWRRGRSVPLPAQRYALERRSEGRLPADMWTQAAQCA